MVEKATLKGADLWRLRLDKDNPRHEPKQQQQDVVDYLAANEDVLPLLEDIAKLGGLSPLDRFGVIRNGDFLIALEGNRRLCSLLLLNDPELAPAKYRARVRAAAAGWNPDALELDVAIFDARPEADPWLERRHQGAYQGRGLKQWSPAAKDRHSGKTGNALALKLLDDGVAHNLITPDERAKRVVTTVRRFTDSAAFRKQFLEISTPADDPEYVTNLGSDVFKERLRVFLWGLFASPPTVTSRMSASQIGEWIAEQLKNPAVASKPPRTADDDSWRATANAPGDRAGSASRDGRTANSDPSDEASGPGTSNTPGSSKPLRPVAPTLRSALIDGESFNIATADPVRRHVIYELSRVRKDTPIAASVIARVFLEGIYLDMWSRTCQGKADSKLHVKVLALVEVARTWDLDRSEKNALDALHRSAQNPGQVLSPAGLGAAAHGASIPSWNELVAQWDTILPIVRRIFRFVERDAGQASA